MGCCRSWAAAAHGLLPLGLCCSWAAAGRRRRLAAPGGLARVALGREEMPHRAPDVVELVERIAAGRTTGVGQLREDLAGLGGELSRQSRGNLDVAGEAGVRGDRGERGFCE